MPQSSFPAVAFPFFPPAYSRSHKGSKRHAVPIPTHFVYLRGPRLARQEQKANNKQVQEEQQQ